MRISRTSSSKSAGKGFPLLLSLLLLLALAVLSLSLGRVSVPLRQVFAALLGDPVPASTYRVIMQLRLPRLLGAVLVGAALSVSGSTYQGIFQNPLVSPDLLGVSSGACAGAALAIILGLGSVTVTVFSFIAGALSVLACVELSLFTRKKSNLVLIFAGVIVGRFMDALVGVMKFFADPESQLGDIVTWQLGSMSKIQMKNVCIMAPVVLICLTLVLLMRWRINLLSLGYKEASSLGVNVSRDRTILILISTLLTAISVCFCGTIAWVGLIIPHIARWIIGSDNRYALPLCAALGSGFMVLADFICRAATDYELPLGVITGLVGAPIFALILIRNSREKEDS